MDNKTLLINVLELIKKYGITAYEIEKNTHLTAVGVQKIIDGVTKKPQLTTLETIKSYITDKYLSKPNNEQIHVEDEKNNKYVNTNGNVFIELNDGTFDVHVKTLPFKAYASYKECIDSGVIYDEMETSVFNVDRRGKGHYMAFLVKGDSMNGGNICDTPDGAKVLGRELGRHLWKDGFKKTEYGWIILSKHNIFHKDITNLNEQTGEITCHSRNDSPEYSDFNISLNDVYQIFKVIKRIF